MTALPVSAPALSLLPALSPAAAKAADVLPGDVLARWLRSLAPTTQANYRRHLHTFAGWMIDSDATGEQALEALLALGQARAGEVVRAWRDHELGRGLASGSVATAVGAISACIQAANRAGLVPWQLKAVAPRIEARRDMRGPDEQQVERLFLTVDAAADAGDRQAVRDAAALRLLFSAGLRRAEVTGLDVAHVDLRAGTVLVLAKGDRERKPVTIPPGCTDALARWLDARGIRPGPLFGRIKGRSRDDGALSGSVLLRRCKLWAKRAGVDAVVRCHGLRHAGATSLARKGSLAQLVSYGRWKTLATPRRYLDDAQRDRAEAMRLVDL